MRGYVASGAVGAESGRVGLFAMDGWMDDVCGMISGMVFGIATCAVAAALGLGMMAIVAMVAS